MKKLGTEKNVKNIVRSEDFALMLMDWANSNNYGHFTMRPDIAGIPMVHEGNSDSWVSVDKFIELYEEDYDGNEKTISV
jgi:hypothetical protein